MGDFRRHEVIDLENCRTAHSVYQAIPEIFPQKVNWTKIQQCKQKPGEAIFDYFERFKKTFKQYSGMNPESLRNH